MFIEITTYFLLLKVKILVVKSPKILFFYFRSMIHRKKSKLIVDFGDWAKKPTEQTNQTDRANSKVYVSTIWLNLLSTQIIQFGLILNQTEMLIVCLRYVRNISIHDIRY